jgi:hypothetical protein
MLNDIGHRNLSVCVNVNTNRNKYLKRKGKMAIRVEVTYDMLGNEYVCETERFSNFTVKRHFAVE